MSDARLFRDQAESLSARHCVQIASLGNAESVRDMGDRVLTALPATAILVGASLGAMVAMDIARRAPDRVSRLVLIATDALAELPAVAAARDPMITQARAGRLDDAMAAALPWESLAPGPGRTEVMDIALRMARRGGAERFQAHMRALQRRPDQQGTLRRLTIPTLLVCGTHDRLFPPRRHEVMAGLIPRGRLITLEEAGHLPTLEAPEKMTAIIGDWAG